MSELFPQWSKLYFESDFYLPIKKLKTGGLYWILARNAHVGVWLESVKGFIIPREKFDRKYLFIEYHWDLPEDVSYGVGTSKPFEFIEMTSYNNLDSLIDVSGVFMVISQTNFNKDLLKYLQKKSEEYTLKNLLDKYVPK